jgi:hypothetical protein
MKNFINEFQDASKTGIEISDFARHLAANLWQADTRALASGNVDDCRFP